MDQDPTQRFEPPVPSEPGSGVPARPIPPAPPAPPQAPPIMGASVSYGSPERPSVVPAGSYGSPAPTRLDVPVAPVGGARRRRNPLRYAVALLIVALVVAGGLGATLLLTGSSGGASALAGYAPADTQLYAEARLDLPGTQRAEVAKTLAAFPGFADQAALTTKLGEVYDRILRAATRDKHDYQTEIAPWFGGQLAVAQGPQSLAALDVLGGGAAKATPSATADPTASLPACTGGESIPPSPAASGGPGIAAASFRYLVLADITDAVKASAWVGSILSESGATTVDRTCDGVAVHVVKSTAAYGMPDMGWAILADKVLVAGDVPSIRLAIATKGATGLSTDASFQKAVTALPGDHLGFYYQDLRAMLEAQGKGLAALGNGSSAGETERVAAMAAAYGVVSGLVPDWVAGDLKAANGNVVVDTAQPRMDFQPATNRASDLAALAPADTIALMDTHDLGKMLSQVKAKFGADPKLQPYVKQLDSALNLLGGFSGSIGWIGDAGFAITRDGSRVSGGVLIRPDDATAATRLFTQLRGFIDLAGSGSGIKATDADYKGVKISTLDLSALAPALESSMGASGVGVPSDLKLVYAATDKVVVLTLDPSFAKAVVDASQGGDSLAKNARFSSLLGQAGASNAGMLWLDITATRELAEGMLPAAQRTQYDADVRPYLLPFDALVSATVVDGDLLRGTMILSVNH